MPFPLDLVPPLVRPQPDPPKAQHSFTSWQVQHPTAPTPGDWLDSELSHTHRTVRSLIDWAAVSLNSDGSLRPDAVRRALSLPGPQDIDNSASDDQYASNVAQDYAVLSRAWAEHMPDTIPPNILAYNDITGDHWSSRWWAHQAAILFSQFSIGEFTDAPGDDVTYGRLNNTWTPVLPLTGGQLTGALELTNGNLTLRAGGFLGSWLEIGSLIGPATPFLDFHSSGTGSDFDTRFLATGGGATPGLGTLTFIGSQFNINAPLAVSGALRGSPLISYQNSAQGGGVGSQSSGWLAGFNVTSGGVLQWGNMDAAGNLSSVRMSLDTGSKLTLNGALAAAGNVTGADIIASAGVWANNQVGFGFNKSGPNYIFYWGVGGDYNYLDANATWHWVLGNSDRMSLTAAGNLTTTGNVSAVNVSASSNVNANLIFCDRVQPRAVTAYIASGVGGMIGSWQGDSSNVGFINQNNVLRFGNGDGNGSWVGPSRMTLDTGGNLQITGGFTAIGTITAPAINSTGPATFPSATVNGRLTVTGEVDAHDAYISGTATAGAQRVLNDLIVDHSAHIGGYGLYFSSIDGGAHGLSFGWFGGNQFNFYVDNTYIGTFYADVHSRSDAPEFVLEDVLAGLETRIAALEARA
jgi:hypothetical protein